MNSDRPPGRSLLLLDSRHVLLDGMMVVDIKLPLEYVAFLGPPMTTLPDFPYAGGALPSSPDNRTWGFGQEPGDEAPRGINMPRRMALRPIQYDGFDTGPPDLKHVYTLDTPILVQVDLGSEPRSRKYGDNLVKFMAGNGRKIGRDGWKLKVSYEVKDSGRKMVFKGWLGAAIDIPKLVVHSRLYDCDGELAHEFSMASEFGENSKYSQGTKQVGREGMLIKFETSFDFGGKPPRQAMIEELLEGLANGGQAQLPVVRGKFRGKYTDLPVTTSPSFPPVEKLGQ